MNSFEEVKEAVWDQYGAAIDMLENAMEACPDVLWTEPSRQPHLQFSYMAFHTLWWLDYYLADDPETFRPPAPFTMDELDPSGVYPSRPYTRDELRTYLAHGREKCRRAIASLTEQQAMQPNKFGKRGHSVLNLHLYNARHVQHHAAQLNLILRQVTDSAPRWVSHSSTPLATPAKEPA
jgi:hypothetical protein